MNWITLTKNQAEAIKTAITSKMISFDGDKEVVKMLQSLPYKEDGNDVFRDVARNGTVEVTEDAFVNETENGAWVMSWSWVSLSDAGLDDEWHDY